MRAAHREEQLGEWPRSRVVEEATGVELVEDLLVLLEDAAVGKAGAVCRVDDGEVGRGPVGADLLLSGHKDVHPHIVVVGDAVSACVKRWWR